MVASASPEPNMGEPELHQMFRKMVTGTERPTMTVEEKMVLYRTQSSGTPVDALQMYERHVLQSRTSSIQRRSPLATAVDLEEAAAVAAVEVGNSKNDSLSVHGGGGSAQDTPTMRPTESKTSILASPRKATTPRGSSPSFHDTLPYATTVPSSPRSPGCPPRSETKAPPYRDGPPFHSRDLDPCPGEAVFLQRPEAAEPYLDDPSDQQLGAQRSCFMCPGFLGCFSGAV